MALTASDKPTCEELTRRISVLEEEVARTARLACVGEATRGILHEINNPITGIINYSQILMDDGEAHGHDVEIPKRLMMEAERIARIVDKVLHFAGDRKEPSGMVDLKSPLADACLLVGGQLKKEGITLRMQVPASLPEITACEKEIQEVFLLIMRHARHALSGKFSGIGEDKVLKIEAESLWDSFGAWIQTTFSYRAEGNLEECGMASGLITAQRIVEAHGGRLNMVNVKGEDTEVVVDLPAGSPA